MQNCMVNGNNFGQKASESVQEMIRNITLCWARNFLSKDFSCTERTVLVSIPLILQTALCTCEIRFVNIIQMISLSLYFNVSVTVD